MEPYSTFTITAKDTELDFIHYTVTLLIKSNNNQKPNNNLDIDTMFPGNYRHEDGTVTFEFLTKEETEVKARLEKLAKTDLVFYGEFESHDQASNYNFVSYNNKFATIPVHKEYGLVIPVKLIMNPNEYTYNRLDTEILKGKEILYKYIAALQGAFDILHGKHNGLELQEKVVLTHTFDQAYDQAS